MKKFLALLLALMMSLSLVACGGNDAAEEEAPAAEEAVEETAPVAEEAAPVVEEAAPAEETAE